MTEDAWESLSPAQQDAVMEAGRIASEYNRELSEGAEQEFLQKLADAGATVIDVPDKSAWQAAVADVVAEATADNAALYQRILDLQ
jgi:TRAP-type C4-dicarboxylate transport system substrate-binding protein